MKETKTAKAGIDCPTLLHYLARVLLRSNPSLVTFIEDLPNVEAGSRRMLPGFNNMDISRRLTSLNSLCTDHHAVG